MKYKKCPKCGCENMEIMRTFCSLSTYKNGKLTSGSVSGGYLADKEIRCSKCDFTEQN